jgi:hypothetical protein
MGPTTLIRCSEGATFDVLAPVLLLFFTTNARDQFELSIDPNNLQDNLAACEKDKNIPT